VLRLHDVNCFPLRLAVSLDMWGKPYLTVTGNKFSRNSRIFAFSRRVPFLPSTTPPYISMQRIPLGTRSVNVRRGPELSPNTRGKIIGAKDFGGTATQIAKRYNHPESTIRSTLKLESERVRNVSQPRSGRPKTYSDRDERHILRHVRLHPKCTYADVRRACLVKLYDSTLKSILKKHGIANWRAKKRPHLIEEHAAIRLAWCIERLDWTVED
jgi:transposase